jgi:PAC2 family
LVVLDAAERRGISHLGLMGQTPHYRQDTENPAAIEALLTYLARLLNRTLDMSQFPKAVREFRAECDRAVAKSREAAGQSGLLVDELVVEREEIAFNAGSTMVSIVMRAADFARLSDAQPCRFAQAPPGG